MSRCTRARNPHNIPSTALEFNENNIEPFAKRLGACPDLQILDLFFQDWHSIGSTWSPATLVGSLGKLTLPSLHTFVPHARSCQSQMASFFNPPDSDPLRAFFARHPGLHTIGLGWTCEIAYHRPSDPNEMAALLPSLIHLETPALLSQPVLASGLADQIQTIAITDMYYVPTEPNLETIAKPAKHLPQLRELVLIACTRSYRCDRQLGAQTCNERCTRVRGT
jgi:hypothetical protein